MGRIEPINDPYGIVRCRCGVCNEYRLPEEINEVTRAYKVTVNACTGCRDRIEIGKTQAEKILNRRAA